MRLIVKTGAAAGHEFEVDRELTVGRAPGSDILLSDGGVSSHHARIRPANGGVEVTDLGSTNGTFVNGHRIAESTVVRAADELRFSTTVAEVVPSVRMGGVPSSAGSRPRLVVRTGANRGREVALAEGQELIIGRGASAGLSLTDGRVSERNTRVRLEGGAIEVADLGSANGTLVDGQPVTAPVRVPEGAEIQVGETVITFAYRAAVDLNREATIIGRRPGVSDSQIERRVEAAVAATERQRGRRLTLAIGGVGLLAVAAASLVGWKLLNPEESASATDLEAKVVEQMKPATVRVVIVDARGELASSGSGSIIDLAAGLILTNNHVIDGGHAQVYNDLTKGRLDAELVGTTVCDDMAVIRVTGLKDKAPGLKQVTFGDPAKIRQGERVVTLGYPGADEKFEDTKLSTTSGIVSKTRTVYEKASGIPHHQNVIQTDAAINHGNSGGPMFNLKGEQIGINTLGSTVEESSGQNYAISVGRIQEVLPALKAGKSPKWLATGFTVLVNKQRQPVGLSPESVYPGGQAEKAGLKGEDNEGNPRQLITKINGQDVKIVDDYCRVTPESGAVTLTFQDLGSGKTGEFKLTAGQR